MAFEIILAPEAMADLRALQANARAVVHKAIEQHLRHQPERTSKSRINRLRGLSRPQYRLPVGQVRVFHDVNNNRVEILGIVSKADANAWLARMGEADENGGTKRS